MLAQLRPQLRQRPALETAPGHLGEPRVLGRSAEPHQGPRSRGRAPAGWSRRYRRSPVAIARSVPAHAQIAQRDVGLPLDASRLVPARAAVADQADAHAGIRRSASAAASLARAGPRSCRASTRACAAAPIARRRAGRAGASGPRPRKPRRPAARPAARWPRPRPRRPPPSRPATTGTPAACASSKAMP